MKIHFIEIDSCHAYFDGSTKIKLVQKWNTLGGTVDAPGYFPLTENMENVYLLQVVKSLRVDSMLHHSDSSKELTKLDISFQLNGWIMALDIRSNENTTFTEIGIWTD